MTVSTITNTTMPTSTTAATKLLADTQENFYKLLVAQMQYQDPMNPMDNSQMTSQIAQMNTVSGINQLNSTVQSLAATMQGSQAMQSASLLGRNVLAAGTGLQLSQGEASFGINFSQAVDNANVTITNSAGNTVRIMALGAQAVGIQNFAWDGLTDSGQTAPEGAYTFAVQASLSDQPVTATTLLSGLVQSISMSTGGLTLNLSGLGNIALSALQQVR